MKYGIEGHKAPELAQDIEWIDGSGVETTPVQLSDYKGKFKIIFGFQSWCSGCHSSGFPALQKLISASEGNDNVAFFAIQTVFEGFEENTKDELIATQKKYELKIPFGHDVGNETTENRSSTMYQYRTGGTPWFIFIDQNNRVVFNDYHFDIEKTIGFLQTKLEV